MPIAALLFYPLVDIGLEYLLFMSGEGVTWIVALNQLQQDFALITFLVGVPAIVLAFFRELQVHVALDKLLGAQKTVEAEIVNAMINLAEKFGYVHLDRIRNDPQAAKEWFYFYANKAEITRARAFEVWEGYYVGLYLSLGSLASFGFCLVLLTVFPFWRTMFIALVPFAIFLALWATRHWSTIPKIKRIPIQQVGDISQSNNVLAEARRRFGD